MAERSTLARPYAKAVFSIAKEHNAFDKWSSMLGLLAKIAENKDAKRILWDRTLPVTEVADFVLEVAATYLNEEAKHLVQVLAANHRLNILPEINAMYEKYYADAENVAAVDVFTVIPVTATEIENFNKLLAKRLAKTVKLSFKIDKSILGGYVARAGNYVIDHSLKNYLIQLKTTLGG